MKLEPMTIASDDEVEMEKDSDVDNDEEEVSAGGRHLPTIGNHRVPATKAIGKSIVKVKPTSEGKGKMKRVKTGSTDDMLNPSFSFDADSSAGDLLAPRGWDFKSAIAKLAKEDPRRARTSQALEEKIAAKRVALRKEKKGRRKGREDEGLGLGIGGHEEISKANGN
ncbi:unnamed protein product, partial [Discosporangium mesarthrocarpum]